MGGLREAGVKSFKHHFRRVAGGLKYTFEEFSTLLVKIEACLNSRPLSVQSENPDDLTALTAGHFVTERMLLAPAEVNIDEPPISIINRWPELKQCISIFANVGKMNICVSFKKGINGKLKGKI